MPNVRLSIWVVNGITGKFIVAFLVRLCISTRWHTGNPSISLDWQYKSIIIQNEKASRMKMRNLAEPLLIQLNVRSVLQLLRRRQSEREDVIATLACTKWKDCIRNLLNCRRKREQKRRKNSVRLTKKMSYFSRKIIILSFVCLSARIFSSSPCWATDFPSRTTERK